MDLIPPPSLVAVAHSLRISKGGGRNGIYKSTFPFLFFAYIVSKVHITGSSPKPVKLSGRAGLKPGARRLWSRSSFPRKIAEPVLIGWLVYTYIQSSMYMYCTSRLVFTEEIREMITPGCTCSAPGLSLAW
ncbi:hypothetical protein LI328DRAFT_132527 [Trichoderma asperelloides]|nr:hypothetical protein LI328DRAFT_132527 [Trichoderma asperelloides]